MFYNNDGKQVGSLSGGIKTVSVKVPPTPSDNINHDIHCPFYVDLSKDPIIQDYSYSMDGSRNPFYELTVPNLLVSITVDSTIIYAVAMIPNLYNPKLHIFANQYYYPAIHVALQGKTYRFYTLMPDNYGDSDWVGKTITLTYY